jgi:hypothetical protein
MYSHFYFTKLNSIGLQSASDWAPPFNSDSNKALRTIYLQLRPVTACFLTFWRKSGYNDVIGLCNSAAFDRVAQPSGAELGSRGCATTLKQ